LISAYRFGFNGKENDDEAYGDDNQQDYGMRVYDPRLGRFLSVDPIAAQYPMLSSYQSASNSPVQAIDLDGLERMHYTRVSDENGKPRLEQIGQEDIVDKVVVSYRSSVSAYNDGAVPVYANKTNERQEHVVHQVRTGYVDGVDGGLGGPKEVQYDVTYTYKTYDNALNDVGGEKGWEEFLYRLMQGASFAHSENKANGGAGMVVTQLQSGRAANAVAKVLSAEQKAAQAGAKAVEDATLDLAAGGATGGAKGGGRVFTQTAKEGDLILYATKIGDDVIEFGGNFSKSNGTLTIKNFDIDGALTNKLGIRGIKDIVTDFGRQQGVNQVIIQGAKRTTGANPGKIPSQLIFKID
jgi:RHS repeat-associated protein